MVCALCVRADCVKEAYYRFSHCECYSSEYRACVWRSDHSSRIVDLRGDESVPVIEG